MQPEWGRYNSCTYCSLYTALQGTLPKPQYVQPYELPRPDNLTFVFCVILSVICIIFSSCPICLLSVCFPSLGQSSAARCPGPACPEYQYAQTPSLWRGSESHLRAAGLLHALQCQRIVFVAFYAPAVCHAHGVTCRVDKAIRL